MTEPQSPLRGRGPLQAAGGLLQLVRPLNAALAALGVLAGMGLAAPAAGPASLAFPAAVFAPLSAALLTGFGNVLNDLRDVQVDRIAHPHRPLPSGRVGRRAAFRLLGFLLSVGLASAALAGLVPLLIATAVVGLLLLYEWRLKGAGLPGNLAVAALTAATFPFGAAAAGQPLAPLPWAAALMALLVNAAREVAKDAQDMAADRGHRRTFPLRIGARPAGVVASLMALLGILASLLFLWQAPPDLLLCGAARVSGLALLAVADGATLFAALVAPRGPRGAQRALKAAMALALAAFLLFAFGAEEACRG